MVNTTYISSEDMISKLQSLKEKTKFKLLKILGNYYDEMNIKRQIGTFEFVEDPFNENVQGVGKTYHEVLLLMKF